MGLTPRQVDQLTLPEMQAMFEGFRQFHGGKSDGPEGDVPDSPDETEFFRAMAEERAKAGQA